MDKALLLTLALLSLLLLTHDLVPLGRWNNLSSSRLSFPSRIASTLLNSLVGLIPTWLALRSLGQHGLSPDRRVILIFLSALLAGELLSWWLPWATGFHLFRHNRDRLGPMTASTYAFVPARHGVHPNALHCVIHLVTLLAFAEVLTLRA